MRAKMVLTGILAMATAASASVIHFDPDGPGPDAAVNAATFDWLPGDALVVENPTANTTTVYFQAKLGSVVDANGHVLSTPGLNAPGGYEITAAFGIDVDADFSSPTIELTALGGSSAVSYFSMYFDPNQDANNLAGTGFRLGRGATTIYTSSIEYALATVAESFPGFPLDLADPSQYPNLTTEAASGGGSVSGPTTSVNNAFFLNGSTISGQFTNGTLAAPFFDVNPSMQFRIGPDGSTTILPFAIDSDNGDLGQIQFESDAATSFQVVPEPAAMLSLLPLAALALRRRGSAR